MFMVDLLVFNVLEWNFVIFGTLLGSKVSSIGTILKLTVNYTV